MDILPHSHRSFRWQPRALRLRRNMIDWWSANLEAAFYRYNAEKCQCQMLHSFYSLLSFHFHSISTWIFVLLFSGFDFGETIWVNYILHIYPSANDKNIILPAVAISAFFTQWYTSGDTGAQTAGLSRQSDAWIYNKQFYEYYFISCLNVVIYKQCDDERRKTITSMYVYTCIYRPASRLWMPLAILFNAFICWKTPKCEYRYFLFAIFIVTYWQVCKTIEHTVSFLQLTPSASMQRSHPWTALHRLVCFLINQLWSNFFWT